jgi:hypothetical protein
MRRAIKMMIQQNQPANWLDTKQALKKLSKAGMKMSLTTLIRFIRQGKIEGKQVGARYFVTVEAIENLVSRTVL